MPWSRDDRFRQRSQTDGIPLLTSSAQCFQLCSVVSCVPPGLSSVSDRNATNGGSTRLHVLFHHHHHRLIPHHGTTEQHSTGHCPIPPLQPLAAHFPCHCTTAALPRRPPCPPPASRPRALPRFACPPPAPPPRATSVSPPLLPVPPPAAAACFSAAPPLLAVAAAAAPTRS